MENAHALAVLAENIRRMRKIQRLTQEELAYRTGLHSYSIGLIERKVKSPTLRSMEKIARALNVSVVELVCEPESLGKYGKSVKEARSQEISRMMRRLNERQADRLLGIMKTIVDEFENARQPLTLKAAEGKSIYRAAKRAKKQKIRGKR